MFESNNESVNNAKNDRKRKKKRSANQIAKKAARRKLTSNHGTELDPESYEYIVNILDVLRNDFATMDDKLVFANNVFAQMIGHEIDFATNQVASRVIDSLMPYASLDVIQRFTEALGPSLRPVCSDKFASHVLEEIIYTCVDRATKTTAISSSNEPQIKLTESDIIQYNNIALKLCKYVVNNIEEFIFDPYANHVLRTAVKCLGGCIDNKENQTKKPTIKDFEVRRQVSQDFSELLTNTGNILIKWPQFMAFGKDELTSGFLQIFLYTVKANYPKLTKSIIKKITLECFPDGDENILSSIFNSESSLHLLETCLAVAGPKMYKKLYEKYFMKNLQKLSLMKGANFSVQRLLDYCPTKELFEEIFQEISEHVGSILEKQHTGVLSSLANACLRLQAKQGPFINVMTKLFDCDEPANRQLQLVPLFASLITYNQYEASKKNNRIIPIHLHGSLILQATLQFNKPIKIVNSMLAMTGADLVRLLSDPKGSRILDSFMDSKYIGEKSREKLFKQIKGHWVELAHGIHGSRCIDKIWNYLKDNQKIYVMEELAAVGESLNSTKTGRLISIKLKVPLFAKNKNDWVEVSGKSEKTKALFADIIDS